MASVRTWPDLLDEARARPDLAAPRAVVVAAAREAAALSLVRRPYTYEAVGTHRTYLIERCRYLPDPEQRRLHALSTADNLACRLLADELPLLAAAYRLTDDALFLERALAQLEELTSWAPLQRPGWTLFDPRHKLPPDGNDGCFLGTGCGLRAIVQTLALLPSASVGASLRGRLEARLAAEIAGIVDDWRTGRTWFFKTHNAITNQWAVPVEGLLTACLALGPTRVPEAFEIGVRLMVQACDAHGPDGEFEEGAHYAVFTVTSLLHAAHALGVAGDRRLIAHPFLRRFPRWLAHHLQPGRFLVNSFDCFGSRLPRANMGGGEINYGRLFSLFVVCTGSPVARWMLARQFDGPSRDLAGLAARLLMDGPVEEPPPYGAYARATQVNWRDGWDDAASGVWVRGGHTLDQHDHQDRGHVNFTFRGRPILIEAGTPAYHNPLIASHYKSGAGHNVLQLGTEGPPSAINPMEWVAPPGWQKRSTVAPIETRALDRAGGDVRVDATACYEGLRHWRRRVRWDAAGLIVVDEVALTSGREALLFRWHLGTTEPVTIEGGGNHFTVRWPGAEWAVEASVPLVVTQEPMPDHTLVARAWGDPSPDHQHVCLQVRTAQPVETAILATTVRGLDV